MEEQQNSDNIEDIEHPSSGDNIDNDENNSKLSICEKIRLFLLLIFEIILFILFILFMISSFFFMYIACSQILHLNFYAICYEWISILGKESVIHIIFSIFGALSDFSIFIFLFYLTFFVILNFVDIYKNIINSLLKELKQKPDYQDDEKSRNETSSEKSSTTNNCEIAMFLLIFVFFLITASFLALFILSFFYFKVLLGVSMYFLLVYLMIFSCRASISPCRPDKGLDPFDDMRHEDKSHSINNGNDNEIDENETSNVTEIQNSIDSNVDENRDPTNLENQENSIKDKENNDKDDDLSNDEEFMNLKQIVDKATSIITVSLMLNKEISPKPPLIYKIVIGVFITMSQIYIIVMASIDYHSYHDIGKAGIVLGIIFRIFYLTKSIDINIFDCIIYMKRTWQTLKEKYIFILTLLFYLIAIIVLIVITVFSKIYDYPYVDLIQYEDRNNIPFNKSNLRNSPDIPQSFCNVHTEDGMDTVDLSILTTISRLYGINEEGKCYIKPKFRGVFNSTMKYIFGNHYHEKGIRIYCWTKVHDPYLIITSEESYHYKIAQYSEENIEILSDDYIKEQTESKEYFNETAHLCDSGIANEECQQLKSCLETKNNYDEECEEEWSRFTNSYWKEQSQEYDPNMKGLEQYQITINEDTVFQPRFIYHDNVFLSGTHYIVGGGLENVWGYASLLENTVRVLIPSIFESFLPFYGLIHDYFREMYNYFSEFALTFIYVKSLSTNEIYEIGNLITHFNISHSNLFLVGHSISATTFKEISYLTDINGISFEGSKGLGYAEFRVSDSFHKSEVNLNQMTNIYSGSSILTGEDEDFPVNGMLPDSFFNPNVYDTSCLTVVTCSTTEKYVPFCKQVLNQHGENPIENFNKLINDYQNR